MKQEERCKKCHARDGSCKHTIEKQYCEWALEMPQDMLELKDSWEYLNRRFAINFTEKLNLIEYRKSEQVEIDNLRDENNQLRKELSHFHYIIEMVEKSRNVDDPVSKRRGDND